MNLPMFDQTREREQTPYGESVRLSNELRSKLATTKFTAIGLENVPVKWGFDCETAPYSDFITWLNDGTIRKSQSNFWFTIRIMVWRFPTKYTEIKNNLASRRRLEFDLIVSQLKKEVEWVGTVGYQNMVRLDDSLTNPRVKIVKLRNGGYKIVRK